MNCLKTSITLLFICIVLLPACKPDGIEEQFMEAYDAVAIDSDLKDIRVVLIVPNAGCQGCISSLEQFVIDQRGGLDGFLIIFTNYSSTKALRVRFTSEILNGGNVFLDYKNLFGRGELSSLYPIIIYLEDGNMKTAEYVSPENSSALANLEFFLDTTSTP